jgi:two-component system KDP operon response regulator KdpE
VALRHRRRTSAGERVIRLGSVTIDLERRVVSRDGADVALTPTEFRLVESLAKRLGMVATHRQLLGEVWGPVHEGDTHYLRIFMKQLRQKLEEDPVRPRYLVTETGVGYRLNADD